MSSDVAVGAHLGYQGVREDRGTQHLVDLHAHWATKLSLLSQLFHSKWAVNSCV